jgi:hypothetical protein
MLNKCKVCGAFSKVVGKLDANKACGDSPGKRLFPISDNLITYLSCP